MEKIKHEIKPWYCSGCSERMFDYCPCCAKCGKPHPENPWRVATEAALTNKDREIKRLKEICHWEKVEACDPYGTWYDVAEARAKEIKRLEGERDKHISGEYRLSCEIAVMLTREDVEKITLDLRAENQRFAVREREMRKAIENCECLVRDDHKSTCMARKKKLPSSEDSDRLIAGIRDSWIDQSFGRARTILLNNPKASYDELMNMLLRAPEGLKADAESQQGGK